MTARGAFGGPIPQMEVRRHRMRLHISPDQRIVSGVLLHHQDVGSGSPVLLLHAGVCDSRMWQVQLEALADSHRVVAPDFRGFGQSALEGDSYSDVGDVLHLLDELEVPVTALVGASYGGRVALELAAQAPERVDRMLLLSPAADGVDHTESVQEFAAAEDALLEATDVAAATDLNVRTWLGPEASMTTRTLVAQMQQRAFEVQLAAGEVESTNDEPELSRIETSTLVVAGEHDLDFSDSLPTTCSPNAQRTTPQPLLGRSPAVPRTTAGDHRAHDEVARLTQHGCQWRVVD